MWTSEPTSSGSEAFVAVWEELPGCWVMCVNQDIVANDEFRVVVNKLT